MSDDRVQRNLELPDAAATMALGAGVAREIRRGDLVALEGDLGAGKTTLVRGALRELGHEGAVPSPTFTLVQQYEVGTLTVFHFDLYRVGSPDELVEIGFEEACADGAVFVEWPAILGAAAPVDRLEIVLDDAPGGARRARLRGFGRWAGRLAALAP